MFKLMDKKIIAILRKLFLLNWPHVKAQISSDFGQITPITGVLDTP